MQWVNTSIYLVKQTNLHLQMVGVLVCRPGANEPACTPLATPLLKLHWGLWCTGNFNFRRNVQTDIKSKTHVIELRHVIFNFRLKVEANIKSKTPLGLLCMDNFNFRCSVQPDIKSKT